ncbi:MAG: rubrerythrin family protein [Candidatus Lokiarchaeota archaeon]|nr:rubrerythrin family protein [Candidatus Lokiarchaeota archaeon]
MSESEGLELDKEVRDFLLTSQRNEITEHIIYKKLAKRIKGENSEILEKIADEELKHYNIWKNYTNEEVKPDKGKIRRYMIMSKVLGLSFAIRKMENGEADAQKMYQKISGVIPEAFSIIKDENKHEEKLVALIKEERLEYVGSIVLGLNDALVELTGALAGYTLAFSQTNLIAMTALITGIAASMSMAASEYLSTRSETKNDKSPIKASIFTGLTYFFTVILLIMPYLLLTNPFLCLGISLGSGIIVIFFFTYYTSVAQGFSFKKRFLEMALISLGIAGISFVIGNFVKLGFGIEI